MVERWRSEEEAAPTVEETAITEEQAAQGQMMPVMSASTLPITAGGFKIILKDAKIYANKVIIKNIKDEKAEKR